MSCWEVLAIQADADLSEIKKAYQTKLKQTPPEEDPEGFMALRQAYEHAVNLCKARQAASSNTLPVHQDPGAIRANEIMQEVVALYADFPSRVKLSAWQALFESVECQQGPVYKLLQIWVFDWVSQIRHLPGQVLVYLQTHFRWNESYIELKNHFELARIDQVFDWLDLADRQLPLEGIEFPAGHDVEQIEAFLDLREHLATIRFKEGPPAQEIRRWLSLPFVQGVKDAFFTRICLAFGLDCLQPDEVLNLALQYTQFANEQAEPWLYLGQIYERQKQFDKAFNAHQKALLIEPSHFAALKGCARCTLQLKQTDQAQVFLQKALSVGPEDQELQCLLSQLNKWQLEPLLRQLNASLDSGIHHDLPQLLTPIIEKYQQSGGFELLEQLLKRLLAARLSPEALLFVQCAWADYLFDTGQDLEAVVFLKENMKRQVPEFARHEGVFKRFIEKLIERGQYQDVVFWFKKIEASQSGSKKLNLLYAESLRMLGQNSKAIKLLNNLIGSEEAGHCALYLRALCYFEAFNFKSCLQDAKAWLDLGGEDALLSVYCGRAEEALLNLDVAEHHYRQAHILSPLMPEALLCLVRLFVSTRKLEAASQWLEQYCKLEQAKPNVIDYWRGQVSA